MKNIARTIEVIANVAIICVAISLGVVLISRTIRGYRGTVSESANTAPVKDQKIELPGVDWSKNEKTLVLAISSTSNVSEGRNYLSNLGVQVDEVLQAPLSSIDVNATPTLLLVSRDGTVIRTWLGKLPPDLEKEVLLSVGAES